VFDPATFCISIAGLFLAIVYLFKISYLSDNKIDERIKDDITDWIKGKGTKKNSGENGEGISDSKLNLVLKDYEIANQELQRRDNITLLIGSILVASSFFILANTSISKGPYPMSGYAFASVGLYLIWLWTTHYTSKRLDETAYRRIRAIEEALSKKEEEKSIFGYQFGIHTYTILNTRSKNDKEKPAQWLQKGRRNIWGYILILLTLSWMILSFY